MKSPVALLALFGLGHILGARKLLIAALLALLPAALLVILRWQEPSSTVAEFLHTGLPNLCLAVTCMLAMFLGCGCVRDLLEERTLGLLLTRPIARGSLALGLLFSAMLLTCALAAFAPLLGFGVAMYGLQLEYQQGEPSVLLLSSVMVLLAIVHTTLFSLLGLRFRKSTVIGVVWLFVVEVGLGSIPGPARMLAPTALAECLLSPNFATRASISAESGEYQIPPLQALCILALMELVLIVLHQRRAASMDFLSADVTSEAA
ncbi:MAG: hypothetical protein EXS14_00810 [Planctomycetes bacterium]|nr:hypothetical protein [Planctomycetota bacterium]